MYLSKDHYIINVKTTQMNCFISFKIYKIWVWTTQCHKRLGSMVYNNVWNLVLLLFLKSFIILVIFQGAVLELSKTEPEGFKIFIFSIFIEAIFYTFWKRRFDRKFRFVQLMLHCLNKPGRFNDFVYKTSENYRSFKTFFSNLIVFLEFRPNF